MNGSDGDLVKAVRDGRREAYDELVRRYAAKIGAVCRSRLGLRGPVEDMVQESFLRAYRGLANLDDPKKFGSWVYGIATRACLDWLNAKERGQVSFDALGNPDGLRKLLERGPRNGLSNEPPGGFEPCVIAIRADPAICRSAPWT